MPDESITIELAKDEALVLFEWLSEQSNADHPIAIDSVEQFALDKLLASFEKKLVEPFDPNYKIILDDVRKRISVQTGH